MLISLPVALASLVTATPPVRAQASVSDCLSTLQLAAFTPSNPQYSSVTAAYNQRLQPSPIALIRPNNAEQIASAVKCAAAANIAVSPLGGGHSYASYGLGGYDNSLVISLENMTAIDYRSDGTARIEGGARLGDIALALNEQGKAVPHGVCPYVGTGHFAYGGFGYPSRLWGLSLDNVYAYDVVLANGSYVTNLTSQVDPDLFWALNGAAPSYGLVTAFYFKTYDAPQSNMHFGYQYNGVSPQTAAAIFSRYQSFGLSAPAELGLTCTIGTGGSVLLTGMYYGSASDFNSTISPLLSTLPSGYQATVESLSWIEGVQKLAGDQSLNTASAKDYRDTFYAKSVMTPQGNPLTNDTILSFFEYLNSTQTSTNWFVEVNLYGGTNSAINSGTLAESSFAYRDRLLTFQLYASSSNYAPPYPDNGVSFVDGMYDILQNSIPDSQRASYVNYVDPMLNQSQWQTLYWNTQYNRLAVLKAKYDPSSTFRNPQSIVPNADAIVQANATTAGTTSSSKPKNAAGTIQVARADLVLVVGLLLTASLFMTAM